MRYKGSLTVEAALIMPAILGIIVLFLYTAMFAHDECAAGYACQTVCAGAVYEDEKESLVEDSIRSSLSQNMILDHDMTITVDFDESCITARVEIERPLIGGTFVYTARAYNLFCPNY